MDYSIRIPSTPERILFLESEAVSKKDLPKIKDYLFKPVGSPLPEFHPDVVAVRIREFVDGSKPATFIKMTFSHTDSGYSDTREDYGSGTVNELFSIASQKGYEKWGELETHSIEYNLTIDGLDTQVLFQEINPVGTYLKVESQTQEGLKKVLEKLNTDTSERNEDNAAVLLAKRLKLI